MTEIQRIKTRNELVRLADQLMVRPDWHEPDKQGVTAAVFGTEFDNAGYWGSAAAIHGALPTEQVSEGMEMWVVVYKDGEAVAEISLATLFAIAAGLSG
jgi:hypothetical protein